jgi:hypothetical protein
MQIAILVRKDSFTVDASYLGRKLSLLPCRRQLYGQSS